MLSYSRAQHSSKQLLEPQDDLSTVLTSIMHLHVQIANNLNQPLGSEITSLMPHT